MCDCSFCFFVCPALPQERSMNRKVGCVIIVYYNRGEGIKRGQDESQKD